MSPSIVVDRLVVRHGEVLAVDGLSFVAQPGAVTVLLGPNGAGKSSTLDCLEGFAPVSGGSVRVLGLDPIDDHRALTRRVGVMLQSGRMMPGIKVGEAVALVCAHHANVRSPDELLSLVGLSELARRPYRALSGGEAQRLALALALAGRPEVVFLDEPTAGVDVAGRQLVRSVLRDLAAQGTAVLVTTHELDEAERVADHVIIVDHGRLVANGTVSELLAGQGDEIRFRAEADLPVEVLASRLAAGVTQSSPGEYVVACAPTPQAIAAITSWLAELNQPLADLRAGRQRLEDVFMRLTDSSATASPNIDAPGGREGRRSSRRRSSGRAKSTDGGPVGGPVGGSLDRSEDSDTSRRGGR
jgi:ABC-2 type transport system ATP-binding protein